MMAHKFVLLFYRSDLCNKIVVSNPLELFRVFRNSHNRKVLLHFIQYFFSGSIFYFLTSLLMFH